MSPIELCNLRQCELNIVMIKKINRYKSSHSSLNSLRPFLYALKVGKLSIRHEQRPGERRMFFLLKQIIKPPHTQSFPDLSQIVLWNEISSFMFLR